MTMRSPVGWRSGRRLGSVLGAGAIAAFLLGGVAGAAGPTRATLATFTFTGAGQSWTVPPGLTTVAVDAFGAQGGAAFGCPTPGGLGGEAQAPLAVTPGETLQVFVGGAGRTSTLAFDDALDRIIGDPGGGFNGGGLAYGVASPAGGGGGASDVRRSPHTLSSRLLVAGGGGGVGGRNALGAGGGDGGSGGGAQGTPGGQGHSTVFVMVDGGSRAVPCPPPLGGGNGGSAGTQSAGGAAGSNSLTLGQLPTDGAFGMGGSGGGVPFFRGETSNGRGGGGGWYGGGGGATAQFGVVGAGGGGGGSGFGPAGVLFNSGVRAGDGQVTISVEVTFESLCALSRRVVANRGQAGAMCAVLNAAELHDRLGIPHAKAGELRAYQQLVQAAQRTGSLSPDAAALLFQLSNALF